MDDRLDHTPGGIVSNVVDLSEVDLADLAEIDNPVLEATLRRIHDEIDEPGEAAAGHNSSL